MARLPPGDTLRLVGDDAASDDAVAPPRAPRRLVAIAAAVAAAGALAALAACRRGGATGAVAQAVRLYSQGPDQFFFLGAGACVDIQGGRCTVSSIVDRATLLGDGSSPECEERCRDDELCTGYVTHETEDTVWSGGRNGKCGLLSDVSDVPAAADGSVGSSCFWRHTYDHNSADIYQGAEPKIPKVIWSFWQNLPDGGEHRPSNTLPPFVSMCVMGWHQLNPDYDIRVLNVTTMWKWVKPVDLPQKFEQLDFRHKVNAVRLAILARYGGVWLDASTFLVKPMHELLSGKPNERTFFHVPPLDVSAAEQARNRRVRDVHRARSWFLAAPPKDRLILRTKACVMEYLATGSENRTTAESEMFSAQQLQDMAAVGLGGSPTAELVADACIFKNVDDDLSVESWWLSPHVRHINPYGPSSEWWRRDLAAAREDFFHRHNATLAMQLAGPSVYALKFTREMRREIIDGIPAKALWCGSNTWHTVLELVGIANPALCSTS